MTKKHILDASILCMVCNTPLSITIPGFANSSAILCKREKEKCKRVIGTSVITLREFLCDIHCTGGHFQQISFATLGTFQK